MKVVNIQCPNCKASLEMNLEKLMVYCPYCRTKLPMDFEVDNYISETEQNKRHESQLEYEKWSKHNEIENRNNMLKNCMIALIPVWIMMAICIIGVMNLGK